MLFDFLVVRQVTPLNPAHAVHGPKYVVVLSFYDGVYLTNGRHWPKIFEIYGQICG
jgi:hypothetical protein